MRKKKIKVQEKTSVDIRRCSQEALDSFGSLSALKVNGDLFLDWREMPAKLPDDLIVRGGAHLSRCRRLIELPMGLIVGEHLDLRWCERLTELPNDLIVGENLYLYGCVEIKKLPGDLTVCGDIYYDSETGFYGRVDEPDVIPKHLKGKLWR
jgi:hypothetical protein